MKYIFAVMICLLVVGCSKPTDAAQATVEKNVVIDRQNSLVAVGGSGNSVFLSDCEKYKADLNVLMYVGGNASFVYNLSVAYGETRNVLNPYSSKTIAKVKYDGNCKVIVSVVNK